MTTPITDSVTPIEEPRAESFVDWFHVNSRLVTIIASIALIGAFVAWFMARTAMNETINSDKQLMTAKQSIGSGNTQLAEADLKKVVDKYGSKPAGAEAGLLLAQMQLDRGDATSAVTGLTDLVGKVGSGPSAVAVQGMLGDAIAQSGKMPEAGAQYEKAAASTTLPNQKSYWLNKAARAYLAGGNAAKAKTLYEGLSTQSDNEAVATEARVRLGEMATGSKP